MLAAASVTGSAGHLTAKPPLLWMIDVRQASPTACWELLDVGERLRSKSYVRDADRQTFVVTRAALRCTLARLTGIDAGALRFCLGRWGKPFLATQVGQIPLNFSVSHSGQSSVIAVSIGGRIGVDIEQCRHVANAQAIADSCLGHTVAAHLDTLEGEVRDFAFLKFWTAAEAFAKATGLGWEGYGGCIPMHASEPDLGDVQFSEAAAPGLKWSVASIDAGTNHVGALVVERAPGQLLPRPPLRPVALDLIV
jgi:4'-phosphopantetheinyl transferase